MLTAEEKKQLVSSLIQFPIETIDQLSVQKQLYEALLQDTVEGKLYKYRAFDSNGYALRNLEAGTLHCSSAVSFNDPFDCKIGITFQSLYKTMYESEFDLIGEILEKFFLVVHKEISLDDCSEDERRVISQLMKNSRLMQFIHEDYSWVLSEEDVAAVLKANLGIIIQALQIVAMDQKIAPTLRICASMLPQLLQNVTVEGGLYIPEKDNTIQDFAIANGITEDADEIELTMQLVNKMHPELESAAVDAQKFLNDWEEKVSGRIAGLFLIGCLCTNYKNRLMWSHYADSHKGFCVEYDFSESSKEVLNVLPLPVMYSKKRPIIPWEAAIEKTPENMENTYRQLMLGLLTKDSEWSYENEWRVFVNATDSADLKMPPISCIYLGASITEENRNKILSIAREKKIPVKQMTVDRGEYALHARDITVF